MTSWNRSGTYKYKSDTKSFKDLTPDNKSTNLLNNLIVVPKFNIDKITNKKQSNNLSEKESIYYNKYKSYHGYHIIDTITLYKKYNPNLRVFNCSIIVKKNDNSYSYYLSDSSDTLLFMHRETPIKEIINSTFITKIDSDNFTILSPLRQIVKEKEKGYMEDLRFFLFKEKLGVSYTINYTSSFSWINGTNLEQSILDISRQFPNEKNWTFFEYNGEFLAIRYYMPLVIYKVDLINNTVAFYKKFDWTYSKITTQLRGGASPVLKDGKYYLFLHTSVEYKTYVLTLDAETLLPLEITETNIFNLPTKYQFVIGAIYNKMKDCWIISMGLDDLYCCISTIQHEDLEAKLHNININTIPKTIYQTWETKLISDDLMNITKSWKTHNPNYEYILFDRTDRINFIKQHFDESVLNTYNRLIPGAFKADLFRYCLLYKNGGVYVDIDTLCMESIDTFLSSGINFIVPIDLNNNDKMGSHNLFNSFIACSPGNKILLDCINMIVYNIENNIVPESNLDWTGPGILGRATNKYLGLPETTSFIGKEGIVNNILFLNFESGTELIKDLSGNILFQNKNGNSDIKRIYDRECELNNITNWGLYEMPIESLEKT
jgi:hypothetical protein